MHLLYAIGHLFMQLKFFGLLMMLFTWAQTNAQFLMDMVDTTTETGRGMLSIYQKLNGVRIGGYFQPQFQIAAKNGIKSFAGGDFNELTKNRFMLRRSRVRIDYVHFSNDSKPGVQMVFQFDANERGFTMRDIWGRVTENNFQLFSFTIGMFARPFGYEVNLSSSDRESPERGRMSQLLMKSERDLGAMVSLDVRKKSHALKFVKVDAGLFNGQGINASSDFDNYKDFIGRVSIKPMALGKKLQLSAGVSVLNGALINNTKYVYSTIAENGLKRIQVDSTASNQFGASPRRYVGSDVQLKIKNPNGFTEIRGEIISGTQTGTEASSETPAALLLGNKGFYVRKFNGAYFYLLQHLFSVKHQLVFKYDWYDPNAEVAGAGVDSSKGFTSADIQFRTFGLGYIYHISEQVKLVLYYDHPVNEKVRIGGFSQDVQDDVFTLRMQFRF